MNIVQQIIRLPPRVGSHNKQILDTEIPPAVGGHTAEKARAVGRAVGMVAATSKGQGTATDGPWLGPPQAERRHQGLFLAGGLCRGAQTTDSSPCLQLPGC